MNGPVESKVTTATMAALVTSFIVAWIIRVVPALSDLATPIENLILGLVTAGVTFLVSWLTKHTPRNDAQTRATGTSDPIPPTDL